MTEWCYKCGDLAEHECYHCGKYYCSDCAEVWSDGEMPENIEDFKCVNCDEE